MPLSLSLYTSWWEFKKDMTLSWEPNTHSHQRQRNRKNCALSERVRAEGINLSLSLSKSFSFLLPQKANGIWKNEKGKKEKSRPLKSFLNWLCEQSLTILFLPLKFWSMKKSQPLVSNSKSYQSWESEKIPFEIISFKWIICEWSHILYPLIHA